MSTSTVFGLTAYHQQEEVVKTKRTLMAAADRKVLPIDSSKFGKASLIKLAALRPASGQPLWLGLSCSPHGSSPQNLTL